MRTAQIHAVAADNNRFNVVTGSTVLVNMLSCEQANHIVSLGPIDILDRNDPGSWAFNYMNEQTAGRALLARLYTMKNKSF